MGECWDQDDGKIKSRLANGQQKLNLGDRRWGAADLLWTGGGGDLSASWPNDRLWLWIRPDPGVTGP